jgi:anti-anti-sigma factor
MHARNRPEWDEQMDDFEIRTTDRHIVVIGELDADTGPALAKEIDALGTGGITIDLGQLSFIDSSGLRVLFVARQANPSIRITGATPAALRVFEIAGVTEHILGQEP